MKYLSKSLYKNLMTLDYTWDEQDAIMDEWNGLYCEEFTKNQHLFPVDLVDALPLLHDAEIRAFRVIAEDEVLKICIDIKHNEFEFVMEFDKVSNIDVEVPFLSYNTWLDNEVLYIGDNRFIFDLAGLGDGRNTMRFEFGDAKVIGENRKLPDGYLCLDDYYNDPKRAK